MASANRSSAANHQEENGEDLMAAPPGLWLPRGVVKEHRKKANIIWVSVLVAFFSYVAYIVWETVESRKDPPTNIRVEQAPFKFPDLAICGGLGEGCLGDYHNCMEYGLVRLISQLGFEDDMDEFGNTTFSGQAAVEDEYPGCKVVPLSKLTVNQTGIDNGDIRSFWVYFFVLWNEDPDEIFDPTIHNSIHTQAVKVFFIDIDQEVEEIGEEIIDAKIPYSRINPTTDEWFSTTMNHMVITLTEFTGLTKGGHKKERQQTFVQSTTTAEENWWWTDTPFEREMAFLQIEVEIGKFEFSHIEEIDPVDAWAIVGAIGGGWQFVVIGFGLFFVFSQKQPPDRKMRNMKKTIGKPVTIVKQRLPSTSSTSSKMRQDVEVDASHEDLPVEWVKKQRTNGSFYYFNVMTGKKQDRHPHESGDVGGAIDTAIPPCQSGNSNTIPTVGRDLGGDSLPPGWIEHMDDNGRSYYIDTLRRSTTWKRPVQRAHTSGGVGVRSIDVPTVHTRRDSHASSTQSVGSATVSAAPATGPPPGNVKFRALNPAGEKKCSAPGPVETAEVVGPHWDKLTAESGKAYYVNRATKNSQWEYPHC